MRVGWKHVAGAIAAMITGALLIIWLGVIDVRASSGHWKITNLLLHWVMASSTRTAALGIDAPPLDNPAYLPLAATHYEAACAICHGSPDAGRSPTVLAMLPPPPDLKDSVGLWSDEELFQIVKHGIRYTGMPAWPVQDRNDEVWAMVAFLRTYEKMDARTYRGLAGLDESRTGGTPFEQAVAKCDSCHDASRKEDNSLVPDLRGQTEPYLRGSLEAFATGTRPSGVMQTAVQGLEKNVLADLARHYSSQPVAAVIPASPTLTGSRLFQLGDPLRKIPACISCHGQKEANPAYPRLDRLSPAYIENQLALFARGTRGGTRYRELMRHAAAHLTPADIEVLSGNH